MEMSVKDKVDTIERKPIDRCVTHAEGLVAPTPQSTTLCCERCNNFETNSKASLLLHVVHCLSNIKTDDSDNGNPCITAVERMNAFEGDKSLPESQTPYGIESHIFNSSASSTNVPTSLQTSRKLFECDVCNMKFSNGANMRRHKMRHTGVKPYECRVCQKRFFRKDHLAEHFTTHTKTLPYHCPICSRGFQRQIAMRAHFQNEHVGQHDLIKTCPLCTYRAGSMKSLRIHFFNRHGIDLDNPGTGGTSSLLLALESHASQVASAAIDVGYVPDMSSVAAAAALISNKNMQSQKSDGKAPMRSIENATPPMHLLTPHVEISTLSMNEHDVLNGNTSAVGGEKLLPTKIEDQQHAEELLSVPTQDHSSDCNAKSMPSSNLSDHLMNMSKCHTHENHITPSISLIPIKQESIIDGRANESIESSQEQSASAEQMIGDNSIEFPLNNKRLTSLIKVSPLKSLLREDLKRRICVKANNRISRNMEALENNNAIQNITSAQSGLNTPICNGTITSTGQESETSKLYNKQILTCLFCGIEFPDETLYFLHKGCHCESNPWKCNICSEQCNNVYEFNSHLLSKSHQ